jgi:hypothetical protein
MSEETTPRKKQALDGTRLNAFGMDPHKLVLIGVDTEDGPGHPLWEPGAEILRANGREAVAPLIDLILAVGFTRYPMVRKLRRVVEVGIGRDIVLAARYIVAEKLWTRPEPFEVPVVALRITPTRWRAMIQTEALPRPSVAIPVGLLASGRVLPAPPKTSPVEDAQGALLLPLRRPASPATATATATAELTTATTTTVERTPYVWPPVPLVPALHDPATVFAFRGHRVWASDPARARLLVKVRWADMECPLNAPLLPLSTTLEDLGELWGGLLPGEKYLVTIVQLSDHDRVKRSWTSKQWTEEDLPSARHPVRPWPLSLRALDGLPPAMVTHLAERAALTPAETPPVGAPVAAPMPLALRQYLAQMDAHGLGPNAPESAFADLRQLLALAKRHGGAASLGALLEAVRALSAQVESSRSP